ncbi:beta-galactosidase [Aureibacillus halotolerans]|uniref:Beta-galactosidase n=1 Tax=Aureibacillus halotolerans TaxID=1508390 RepID=A0A4R6U389_9BACI|nr:beta-galactosidase [Aureibacillus halotolerans]TDQ40850.1 beta-galactosidase [Aureibacillus halotolerans]
MIYIGVDYYPEQWERSQWESDVKLMKASGVNVVRLAEFAWSRLEPKEGAYCFGWLDDAIDLFASYGIDVVLGIPTMTPPNWLVEAYPDVLPQLDNHLGQPGVRGHRCYNSPSYQKKTRQITRQLAAHYNDHPAVIGWQTDNEFALLMCGCEHCTEAFHMWLKRTYGSLEMVNKQWGTVVWSGEYSSWSQIRLPKNHHTYFNPSFLLDYRRFQSESVTAYQHIQIEEIRKLCPTHFITHNTWADGTPLHHYELFKELDFASIDYYPNTSPEKVKTNPYSGALLLDRTRGMKQAPFWVMEQLSGPPGSWQNIWRAPYPGFIRAAAWQSISRGADGVVFFRWRTAAVGSEQYWHGLLDHHGVPGRRLEEFSKFSKEVGELSSLLEGTTVNNNVAILWDFDSHTSFKLQKQTEGLDFEEHVKELHRSLLRLGLGVDLIDPKVDISSYRLIIVPMLYVLTDETAAKLEAFVEKGGILVVTPRTGVKLANNQMRQDHLPGPLARCLGVRVTEYDSLGLEPHSIQHSSGIRYSAHYWSDLLELQGAEASCVHADQFYKGTPAVTKHAFGKGAAYYLGTFPEEAYYDALFADLSEEAGLSPMTSLPEGVQVSVRERDGVRLVFLLNMSRQTQTVPIEGSFVSQLSGESVQQKKQLEPYAIDVLTPAL